MLIWNKDSARAALSRVFPGRIQHTQPAAAFPSLLSSLSCLRALSARCFRHFFQSLVAARKTKTTKLPGIDHERWLMRPIALHDAGSSCAWAPPRFLMQRQSLSLCSEFSPFMSLHLRAGAMACFVSGAFCDPEVFLVS